MAASSGASNLRARFENMGKVDEEESRRRAQEERARREAREKRESEAAKKAEEVMMTHSYEFIIPHKNIIETFSEE